MARIVIFGSIGGAMLITLLLTLNGMGELAFEFAKGCLVLIGAPLLTWSGFGLIRHFKSGHRATGLDEEGELTEPDEPPSGPPPRRLSNRKR